ncbi:histidine kinase [Amycolatopsis sp. ATCC 39116]|uniref:histidine kinase n=1 Tax=Amycolatopsis sp. (strain ATCC 39116 / 75iv2) TaxID=385957 RepID=UPI0009FFEC7F|nr:histidine kinase [Amycolatopsis sp. ATCC 39116]
MLLYESRHNAQPWELIGGLVAIVVAVAATRRSPWLSLTAAVASSLAMMFSFGGRVPVWPVLLMVPFACLAGRRMESVRPALATFLTIGGIGVPLSLAIGRHAMADWGAVIGVMLFAAVLPWQLGRYMRTRDDLVRSGWQRAEELELRQRIVAEEARLRERARIASDMHDSLGHELSLIALRAAALEMSGSAEAKALRESAAAATERLREIIGLLREDAPPVDPVHGGVPALVERARASGVDIEFSEEPAVARENTDAPSQAVAPPQTVAPPQAAARRQAVAPGPAEATSPQAVDPPSAEVTPSQAVALRPIDVTSPRAVARPQAVAPRLADDATPSQTGAPARAAAGPHADAASIADPPPGTGSVPPAAPGQARSGNGSVPFPGSTPDASGADAAPPLAPKTDNPSPGAPARPVISPQADASSGVAAIPGTGSAASNQAGSVQPNPSPTPSDPSSSDGPASEPPMVERAAYRVVQEALTNVTKHAPGARVAVTISRGHQETVVRVCNGPPPAGPLPGTVSGRQGLEGLRERVRLLGGTLRAGPLDGGFEVVARLPHAAAPAPVQPVQSESARRHVQARREVRRRLLAALIVPPSIMAGLLGVVGTVYLYEWQTSVLDPADYEQLRPGQVRAEIAAVLPQRQRGPHVRAPEPPGLTCEYYGTGRSITQLRLDAYRLCFAGDRLVSKELLTDDSDRGEVPT